MIKAILLDLDNTLIRNPDRAFATEYLRLCDHFFYERWKIDHFSQLIISAVRAMASGNNPRQTNAEAQLNLLHEKTHLPKNILHEGLADFFVEQYPILQHCTGKIIGASKLVHYLLKTDYALVIATNPLYPLEAIQQRLRWAGVPDNPDDYAFVTHSDNTHFTKPHPSYYAEILARVGIEPDEAIMIGDSLKNDIVPADALGLHSFQIDTDDEYTLVKLVEKLDQTDWLSTLHSKPLSPAMIPIQYNGNIGAMFGLLDQVRAGFWLQHPDPNEWSIMQVLCHLRDSERDHQLPRLQKILMEDNPFLANPNTPPGPNTTPCDNDGYRVAHQFADARQQTIEFLENVDIDNWYRPARHSIFGNTTLLEMAHFTAQHDRLHLNQLCQTIGNCE